MKTVLVVEDDTGIQAMIGMALEDKGYRILHSIDGPSLRLALEQQPDMILLDVHMPRMDGVQVSQELRENGLTAHIPIVAMTAAPEEADRAGLVADQWLNKPFDLDDLYRIVAHWTSGSGNKPLTARD